jgi:hypothetical protein
LLLGVVLGSLTADVVKALGLKKLVNLQNDMHSGLLLLALRETEESKRIF